MLPDLAPMIREFYLARTEITDLVGDQVHVDFVGERRSWPLLLVTMLPAQSVTPNIDRAVRQLVQVEGFGADADDYAGASLIVRTAHALARAHLPTFDHAEAHVTDVAPEVGPQPLPDNEHNRARYQATYRVTAHPRVTA